MEKAALIYMASGFSSRFGSNKLLLPFKGKPLYSHGLECLMKVAGILQRKDNLEVQVIVVSQYREILENGAAWGAYTVYNGRSAEGITASLRMGILAAAEDTDLYLFSVADQPYMREQTLVKLVRGCLKRDKAMGCVCCGNARGNPAVFGSMYREELLALEGDRGGSVIMRRHQENLWLLEVSGDELKDIDVRGDLDMEGR